MDASLIGAKRSRDIDYRHFFSSVFDITSLRGTLLDVGCAMGSGIKFINAVNPKLKCFGTDVSSVAIERAKQRGIKGTFFQHDMEKPLNMAFDTVLCFQTLEHVHHPMEMLNNLLNIAIHLLIISVPFLNKREHPNHLWWFDENSFHGDKQTIYKGSLFVLWDLQKKGFSFNE